MKKRLLITLGCVLAVSILGACGNKNEDTLAEESTLTTSVSVEAEVTDESVTEESVEQKPKGHPGRDNENIEKIKFDDLEHFEVTSTNLSDGIWDSKISNTDKGENISPELSWETVEGATCYQVLMIDEGWLHMDVYTEDCDLIEGQIGGNGDNRYVGPYPPSGTHTYNVYVVAMKAKPGESKTRFDAGGNDLNNILSHLNIDADGNTGNVISCGTLTGTYTRSTDSSAVEEKTTDTAKKKESVKEETPAHTHNYKKSVTIEATCTKNGTVTYTCECGSTYEESTPVAKHNFGDNAVCSSCGVSNPNYVSKHTHTWTVEEHFWLNHTNEGHYAPYICECRLDFQRYEDLEAHQEETAIESREAYRDENGVWHGEIMHTGWANGWVVEREWDVYAVKYKEVCECGAVGKEWNTVEEVPCTCIKSGPNMHFHFADRECCHK